MQAKPSTDAGKVVTSGSTRSLLVFSSWLAGEGEEQGARRSLLLPPFVNNFPVAVVVIVVVVVLLAGHTGGIWYCFQSRGLGIRLKRLPFYDFLPGT